jgi:HECT-domain (ubiquitin-transferase)
MIIINGTVTPTLTFSLWMPYLLIIVILCSACFNRIDLPVFDSKAELREKLTLAVTMSSTGFDIE